MINSKWYLLASGAAFLLLLSFAAACGDSGGGSGGGGVCTSGAACVNLGTAGDLKGAGGYVILAETTITNTNTSVITGNIGLYSGTSIVGFALSDPPTTYTTSTQVSGKVYINHYDPPTPANLNTAVLSMEAAYTEAATRTHGVGNNLNFKGGTLNGDNLTPGTYTWGSAVHITGDITLTGTATDVWIFQISGTLAMDGAKSVILAGGAQAKNIFWQVADTVAIGANSHFEGIILGQTQITFGNQATINGRLLAQSEVALDQSTVVEP